MKNILLISLFCNSFLTFGQTFNKKYFSNTCWFNDNKDSVFFKADTVRLIKYSNYGPKEGNAQFSNEHAENESDYLGHGAYIILEIKKRGIWVFTQTFPGSAKRTGWPGPLTWRIDKLGVLSLLSFNTERFLKFRPISERQVKINSSYSGQSELLTSELTLIRIK